MATEYRPIPRLAVGVYPLTNVTPFTYRDGVTYEKLLHQLIERMNTIIGEVNTNNQALFDVVIENMNITIDAVNAALGEQTDEVDQKLADLTLYVNNQVQELTEYVDTEVGLVVDMRNEMEGFRNETEGFRDQAEIFAANTVELQELAVAQILSETVTPETVFGGVHASRFADQVTLDIRGDGVLDSDHTPKRKLTIPGVMRQENLALNPTFSAPSPENYSALAPVNLTFGTFNIAYAAYETNPSGPQWDIRKNVVASQIHDSGADIVALQEASSLTTSGLTQADELVELLNTLTGVDVWRVTDSKHSQGSAILWDTRVVELMGDVQYLPVNKLKTAPGSARLIPWASFTHLTQGVPFHFFSVHSTTNYTGDAAVDKARRMETSELLLECVQRLRSETNAFVIMGGDWNVTYEQEERELLTNAGFFHEKSVVSLPVNGAWSTFNGYDADLENRDTGAWIDGFHFSSDVNVTSAENVLPFASGTTPPIDTPIASDHNFVFAQATLTWTPQYPAAQDNLSERGYNRGGSVHRKSVWGGRPALVIQTTTPSTKDGRARLVFEDGGDTFNVFDLEVGDVVTASIMCHLARPLTVAGREVSQFARSFYASVELDNDNRYLASAQAPNEAGSYLLVISFVVPEHAETSLTFGVSHGHSMSSGRIYFTDLTIVKGLNDGSPILLGKGGADTVETVENGRVVFTSPGKPITVHANGVVDANDSVGSATYFV